MNRLRTYFQVALEINVVKRAIIIAFVVGFLLNAINQGEHIILGDFEQINLVKFILTFLVPYIVSTYSSVFVKLSFVSGEVAGIDAEIACKSCGNGHIKAYRGEIIPYCTYCNKKTKWRLIRKINPLIQLKDKKYKSMALFSNLNPAPVVRVDSEGEILEGNPAAKVLFESDEIIGKKITDYFPKIEKINFKKCIENNELINHIDSYKNFHFHLEVRGTSEIGIAQIYGSNITDLINVKKKSDIMAMFVKFNPAPVLRFDNTGKIRDSNSVANEIFHVKTIIGENISNFFPEISKMNIQELIDENVINNLNFNIDNKIFNLTLRGVSELNRCFIYASDITELQAAKKISESMALFAELNPEPVFRFDKSYIISQANPVANDVFPNIDIVGGNVKEFFSKIKEINAENFINNNEQTTIIEKVGEKIFRFIIRGISELGICQIYGSDITEQQKAKKSAESMALFAELNPEPVFRFDKSYIISQANLVANDVFPNVDIVGGNVKEFLPKIKEINAEDFIKNNEQTTIVENIEEKIFRFMIKGISELGICQIYGSDITKRVQAEQKIRKQAENIQSSIRYAKRIQTAVLPKKNEIIRVLPNHFVLFKPRDIVSGDFYWVKEIENKVVAIAADSTGHGVPGAFMSMLGMSFLNELVTPDKLNSPGQILDELREHVKTTLSSEETGTSDGMDIALSIIDREAMEVLYAGAYNPLYIFRNNKLLEYKADRMPIGMYIKDMTPFNSQKIQLEKGDMLYMFSDGYHDQSGGENLKKFSTRSFKELLLKIHKKDVETQKQLLDENIITWMDGSSQIDDIVVMGIRI